MAGSSFHMENLTFRFLGTAEADLHETDQRQEELGLNHPRRSACWSSQARGVA